MKRTYHSPRLFEYGSFDSLTLGTGGTLPDIDQNNVVVNDNCLTETFVSNGSTIIRSDCHVITVS